MARLIFLVVAIGLVYWLLRRFRQPPAEKRGSGQAEDMVNCARCGIHLPRSESITDGDDHYCCEVHRRGGTRQ